MEDLTAQVALSSISPISNPIKQFCTELDKVKSLKELMAFGERWRPLADDAFRVISAMTDTDLIEFKNGLTQERGGVFSGLKWQEKYAAILMPSIMFAVSMKAIDFKVPWGLMYIRMRDTGKIVERGGIATQPNITNAAAA